MSVADATAATDDTLWELGRGPARARERWKYLATLLDRLDRKDVKGLSVAELKQVGRLYRQVTIDLSRARTDGTDPDLVQYLNSLAVRAHGQVYSSRRVGLRPIVRFITGGFPRLIRRQWKPCAVATGIFLVTTVASFLAVARNPEVAYSLFDEHHVEIENIRLEKQEGEYRGNFTFSVTQSPFIAVMIIGNNIRVAILGFALGALVCLPGVLLLTYNGRMLGTLSGLVFNGGYLIGFLSLIMTHGVLELSAICIASGGGLLIGWSVIAPGDKPRSDALKAAAADGFGLLGGAMLMLVLAGIIEAYVTPHCSATVRWTVAATSAIGLALYFGLLGYRTRPGESGQTRAIDQSSPRAMTSR